MPLLNSVTTPYAEALLQVVSENDQTEEMVKEVKQLLSLINDESSEIFKDFCSFNTLKALNFFASSISSGPGATKILYSSLNLVFIKFINSL